MDESLLRAADRNYTAAMSLLMSSSERGESFENHDIVITNSGFGMPEFNLVFLKPEPSDLERAIACGRDYFEQRGYAHQFRARQGYDGELARRLRELGYVERRPVTGMVLRIPEAPRMPQVDLEVRCVSRSESIERFGRIAFQGFGHPTDSAPMFLTAQLAEHPSVECYVGYADGVPICTSMLVALAEIAGIYWVATLPAYRGRGFGEAITWAAIQGGVQRGFRAACLQASEMGRSVYARMGFEVGPLYTSYESPGSGA